jgi:hypothetical protein
MLDTKAKRGAVRDFIDNVKRDVIDLTQHDGIEIINRDIIEIVGTACLLPERSSLSH